MVDLKKFLATSKSVLSEPDDYDYAGYRKKYGEPDQSNGKHLTDEFKKPNHITFSTESIYNKPGQEGGRWEEEPVSDNDKSSVRWHFYASPYNVKIHGSDKLKKYFKLREPDAVLHLPEEDK